jgi:hypothetical protein
VNEGTSLFKDVAFEPETLRAMTKAFDLACEQLGKQPDLVKEIVAVRIIELAKRGVTDPRQLCEDALLALTER